MSRLRAPRTRHLATASAVVLLATASAAVPAAASATVRSAAGATKITVKYPISGSTYLKAPDTTVTLGPGTLRSRINLTTRSIRAKLTLPPATVSFMIAGVVPVTATTELLNDGPTKGTVNLSTGAVSTTSKVIMQITSMSVAGVPVDVGSSCESQQPAVINLASQPGFSVANGGKLAGSYTLPPFANCGLTTPLINLTTTGPGNTITLTLGKAHRVK